MSDMRLWNRDTISDLIEMYKAHTCLWKVSCNSYNNKHSKALAYKQLVQFCKNRGFPDATRDFVVRKIQSLRGSFRKELRKTLTLKSKGKLYKSSLWYYNNLLFTKDQENLSCTRIESGSDEEVHSDDDEVADAKFEVDSATNVHDLNNHSDSVSPPASPPPKRKKKTVPQLEFYDIGQDTPKEELSEFQLTGMNLAKKLARMDETQAIYAESIVNSVIKRGLLKKLSENTDLCDNMCERRILTVLPQSTYKS